MIRIRFGISQSWKTGGIITFVCSIVTTFLSCSNLQSSEENKDSVAIVKVSDINKHPFRLSINPKTVKICPLNKQPNVVTDVKVLGDQIVIQSGNTLLIYDKQGIKQRELVLAEDSLQAWGINGNDILIMGKAAGWIYTYDTSGNLKSLLKPGRIGVNFARIDFSHFAFQSCGLKTADPRNASNEIVIYNSATESKSYFLPYEGVFGDTNFFTKGQFSQHDKNCYFIPSFCYTLFQVTKNSCRHILKFDFGKFGVDADKFLEYKYLQNFNIMPYVLGLTHSFNSKKYSFFKFTLSGKEGYLLLERRNNAIIAKGVGSIADIRSSYLSIVPAGFINEHFLSVSRDHTGLYKILFYRLAYD